MDSKLVIATIKESCYQVGYPTNDKEHKCRKLINQSYDYAIECIGKLEQIKKIINEWTKCGDNADVWAYKQIREVLEKERE